MRGGGGDRGKRSGKYNLLFSPYLGSSKNIHPNKTKPSRLKNSNLVPPSGGNNLSPTMAQLIVNDVCSFFCLLRKF
jgi:hypothetical protein